MCNHIGGRLINHQTLALGKLYNYLLSMLVQPRAIFDQLKHGQVLWLNHHSFEKLPDALEYYLVDPKK